MAQNLRLEPGQDRQTPSLLPSPSPLPQISPTPNLPYPRCPQSKEKMPQGHTGGALRLFTVPWFFPQDPKPLLLLVQTFKTSPEHKWIWQLPKSRDPAEVQTPWEFQTPRGKAAQLPLRSKGTQALGPDWHREGWWRQETDRPHPPFDPILPLHAPSFWDLGFLESGFLCQPENALLCLLSHLQATLSCHPPLLPSSSHPAPPTLLAFLNVPF